MNPQTYTPQPDQGIGLFLLIPWLFVIGCAIWVYADAKSIGARKGLNPGFLDLGPVGWALCTLLFWILGFPLYLAQRSSIKEAIRQRTSPQRYQTSPQVGWANAGWQPQGWVQNPPSVLPPANWYEDPQHPGYNRWWDGHQWTEHRTRKPF